MEQTQAAPARERFRSLVLRVDLEADIGEQVIVARAAGYSWKQICRVFERSRQVLHERAEEARARLKAQRA